MLQPTRFLSPLLAVALAITCQPAAAASPQSGVSSAEATMRESMMLGDFERVEYRDVEGNPLTFEQFMDAVKTGKSFAIEKESDHSLAVIRLNDPGRIEAPSQAALAMGTPLPAIGPLRTLDGEAVSDAELRSGFALLSFYFAECIPCVAEVPALNAYSSAHPEIHAWAVTFDDLATSSEFVAKRDLRLPVIADAQAFIDAVGVKTYPTWVLVSDGRIAALHTGGAMGADVATEADIEAWVAAAMEPPVTASEK